jgi:hypothetical protein
MAAGWPQRGAAAAPGLWAWQWGPAAVPEPEINALCGTAYNRHRPREIDLSRETGMMLHCFTVNLPTLGGHKKPSQEHYSLWGVTLATLVAGTTECIAKSGTKMVSANNSFR